MINLNFISNNWNHECWYEIRFKLQFKEIRKWLIIPHTSIGQFVPFEYFLLPNSSLISHSIMTHNKSWWKFANGFGLNIDYKGVEFCFLYFLM